jgi:hypothetical protein
MSVVAIRNEVLESDDVALSDVLLPVMQNLHIAVVPTGSAVAGGGGQVLHHQHDGCASAGTFHPDVAPQL